MPAFCGGRLLGAATTNNQAGRLHSGIYVPQMGKPLDHMDDRRPQQERKVKRRYEGPVGKYGAGGATEALQGAILR